jgi:hypothetical protein
MLWKPGRSPTQSKQFSEELLMNIHPLSSHGCDERYKVQSMHLLQQRAVKGGGKAPHTPSSQLHVLAALPFPQRSAGIHTVRAQKVVLLLEIEPRQSSFSNNLGCGVVNLVFEK